jgi:hypothetical protein
MRFTPTSSTTSTAAYAVPSTAKTQRSRADGILLTKQPRETKDKTGTANRTKSLGFEAPTGLQ